MRSARQGPGEELRRQASFLLAGTLAAALLAAHLPGAAPTVPRAAAATAPAAVLPGEPGTPGEDAATEGPIAEESSPTQAIADALQQSPLYVDPAYDSAFPGDRQDRVRERLEESDLPLYVIVVPLIEGDAWDGDPVTLATLVHERSGAEAGHYLAFDGSRVQGLDVDPNLSGGGPAHYGGLASTYETDFGSDLTTSVESAVDAALSEDPEARYQEAADNYESSSTASASFVHSLMLVPVWVWAALALLVLLAPVGLWALLSRRRRESSPVGPVSQHAAFDNADRARLDLLVERAERDLIELGERLRQDSSTPPNDVSRALDARDAASRVFDRMRVDGPTLADAAGVLVLLDRAEDALAGASTPRRPCYANPLHGTGTAPTDWREFGGTRRIRVPLCKTCAKAVRNRRRPTVLPAEYEGREVPYYEVPESESVWAATGYGALRDDLVERVLRGDHAGRS